MLLVSPQTQLSFLPSLQSIIYEFHMQQGVFALLQNEKPLGEGVILTKSKKIKKKFDSSLSLLHNIVQRVVWGSGEVS